MEIIAIDFGEQAQYIYAFYKYSEQDGVAVRNSARSPIISAEAFHGFSQSL
jgi:hypothetical protein